jgi:hypothetical protein
LALLDVELHTGRATLGMPVSSASAWSQPNGSPEHRFTTGPGRRSRPDGTTNCSDTTTDVIVEIIERLEAARPPPT